MNEARTRPDTLILQAALELWGLQDSSPVLIAERENQVFRVDAPKADTVHEASRTDINKGLRYALRFHRPGYRKTSELLSELTWTRALADRGMAVAEAVTSRSGRLIEEVAGWQVDLLTWLDGAPMGQSYQPLPYPDSSAIYRDLGRTMARLHVISDDWQPPEGFERWAWDCDGLLGEQPLWGRFWDNPRLDPADRSLMLSFREQAQSALAAAGAQLDYGLIHADLVRENVMLAGQGRERRLSLIDFDDGGYGYRLFEIATALLKVQAEPNFASNKQALLEGYAEVRRLDLGLLSLFMALRAVTYLGWIVPRLSEQGADQRQARFVKTARSAILAYLEQAHLPGR